MTRPAPSFDPTEVATTCGMTWADLDAIFRDGDQLHDLGRDYNYSDPFPDVQLLGAPLQGKLLGEVAATVLADPGTYLEMGSWHQGFSAPNDNGMWKRCPLPSHSTFLELSTPEEAFNACGTTHCLAGHAIYAMEVFGFALEQRYGALLAGHLLLGSEAASHFYDDHDGAVEYLTSKLATATPS